MSGDVACKFLVPPVEEDLAILKALIPGDWVLENGDSRPDPLPRFFFLEFGEGWALEVWRTGNCAPGSSHTTARLSHENTGADIFVGVTTPPGDGDIQIALDRLWKCSIALRLPWPT